MAARSNQSSPGARTSAPSRSRCASRSRSFSIGEPEALAPLAQRRRLEAGGARFGGDPSQCARSAAERRASKPAARTRSPRIAISPRSREARERVLEGFGQRRSRAGARAACAPESRGGSARPRARRRAPRAMRCWMSRERAARRARARCRRASTRPSATSAASAASSASPASPVSASSRSRGMPASAAREIRTATSISGSRRASSRSSRRSCGSLRRRCGGATSSTTPPPSVAPEDSLRAKPRTMKRSPGSTGSGSPSTWMRAKPGSPGTSSSAPIGARRARRSQVAASSSTETGPRRARRGRAARRARRRACARARARRASRRSGRARAARARHPGGSARSASPARPARAARSGSARRARARAARPGRSRRRSPTPSGPPSSVPVTTAPKPFAAKARSIASRGGPLRGVRGAARSRGLAQRGAQLGEPGAGLPPRPGTIGAPASGPRGQQRLDLFGGERRQLRRHQIGLGERDHAVREAEQLADREVLARLRHHALVGGDHQQHEVDPGRAGHHRAHEPLVSGHVDQRDAQAARRDRAARSRARW